MPTRRPRKARRTAVLLIDFINPLDFPEASLLAPRAIRAARWTAALKRKARAARIPCIYVNDNFGAWTSSFEQIIAEVEAANEAARKIVGYLRPEPGDMLILKPRHSAFYGTALEFLLEELAVKRLVVTGVAADNCVFASAQDAYVRKFEVWVPANCVAAPRPAHEAQALAHMRRTLKARVARYSGRGYLGGA
jgi:nicotinamidase-related amidase